MTTASAPRPRPFPAWPTLGAACLVVATAFVVAIVAGIPAVIIFGTPKNPGDPGTNVIEAAFYLGGAAVLIPLLEALAQRPLPALGLHRLHARDWGFVAGGIITVLLVQFLYQFALGAIHQQNHIQAGFEHFRVPSKAAAAMVLINGALIAPIVEELFFRGLIFNALAIRAPVFVAALLSGALFGMAHGDPVLAPALAIFGLVQAGIYRATGNLVVPMIVHAVNNAIFLSLMIAIPGFH
ncbi:MAG TPA: type II CAAX endopeptidase family protein [Thermoanaerobaculia bacterium]|nr:type II CAAX endopeptidase family protein [Thermoanaerobaculia bacterium]